MEREEIELEEGSGSASDEARDGGICSELGHRVGRMYFSSSPDRRNRDIDVTIAIQLPTTLGSEVIRFGGIALWNRTIGILSSHCKHEFYDITRLGS